LTDMERMLERNDLPLAAQDVKKVLKHGNLVTNLLKLKLERNLNLQDQIHFGSENQENETSFEEDSELIICYEPLDDQENLVEDERSLQDTTFKLLENFFVSFPDLLNEIMLQPKTEKPKIYKTYLRKCRICQRAYTNQKDLDEHKLLHFQMDRSFRCKFCRKLFFDIRNLKNHEKAHVRENSKCSICLKEFRFQKYLDQHMIQHHEEVTSGVSKMDKEHQVVEINEESEDEFITYPCDQCGKVFRNSAKLTTHANVHFGYKPFKCKKCPKSFSKQVKLRKHLANHKTNPDIMLRKAN